MRTGLDLGGTKIACTVLDATGREIHAGRSRTPRGDYEGTVHALAVMARAADDAAGTRCSVGVGIPGAICRRTGLVKNANSAWLNGRPLHRDLEAELGRPVRIANDANCFATSEAVDGSGRDGHVVFGCIVGTGCGGGLVIGRRPHEGLNSIGSELGLNALPWPTPEEFANPLPSSAFRDGLIDAWCSGTGLAADHNRRNESTLTAPEIVAAAATGDEACEDSLGRYEHRLARALALVVNLLDPDVIVLGGGMSNVSRIYDAVPRLWTENDWIAGGSCVTPVRPPVHGDDSGKRGAAWLWLDEAGSA